MSTALVFFFSDSIAHTCSSSLSFSLSLFVFSLCRLPGYYFEIRSICAIRINTQVGSSSASDTADPCSLFGMLLVVLTLSVETSTSICLHTHSPRGLMLSVVLNLQLVTYLFVLLSGVPGRAGAPHGSGRQRCQAGSVDQCVSGCFGETLHDLGWLHVIK